MSNKNYVCMKCNNFECINFKEIKRHCLRKNPCSKRSDVILLSDDQLLVLTLIPFQNNEPCIDIYDLEYLSNSKIITKNKIELFNEIDSIEKHKDKKCKFCNKNFNLITDLKKHIITKCFYEELCNREKIELKEYINIYNIQNNIENKIEHNITNNINVNGNMAVLSGAENITFNTTNNITNNKYSLYFNLPVPFEESWDISEISKSEKSDIMISQYVYSKFLNEILKNEKNSNVIIDKDNKSGMVYMNHKNKYIEMKGKDIIMKTMEKLYDQLNDLVEDNKECSKFVKEYSKEYIHEKFNKYCDDKETKEITDEIMYETYHNYNENAKIMSKNVQKIKDQEHVITKCKNRNKKKYNDRREIIDIKTKMDKYKECRYDDFNFLYDSDGNPKV